MPLSRKYPIEDLLDAARDYTEEMNRLITFEYVLIDNMNASESDAKKLVQLTHRIPCKVNVIPCNSSDPEYKPPSVENVQKEPLFIPEILKNGSFCNAESFHDGICASACVAAPAEFFNGHADDSILLIGRQIIKSFFLRHVCAF